ncbi:MAG: hypothetical protein ACE5H6_03035 [Dehalococcoidia bacterium]
MKGEGIKVERTPSNHMEVEGELCKLFYQRFGKAALPIIEAVFGEWGRFLGEKMGSKLPSRDFCSVVRAHIQPALEREPKPEILESSPSRVELKVFACPYHLEGKGRELCQAMMAMDREIIKAAAEVQVKMSLPRSIAAGDGWCHGIFESCGSRSD